jgi:hypothetical protein
VKKRSIGFVENGGFWLNNRVTTQSPLRRENYQSAQVWGVVGLDHVPYPSLPKSVDFESYRPCEDYAAIKIESPRQRHAVRHCVINYHNAVDGWTRVINDVHLVLSIRHEQIA